MPNKNLTSSKVINTTELGQLIRQFRKDKGLTLETVAGLGNVSIRFLSELE